MTDNKTLADIGHDAWHRHGGTEGSPPIPLSTRAPEYQKSWHAAAKAIRRAVIDECIQIVSAGVKWEPEEFYSDTHIKASNETAYLLAKALEGLKGETAEPSSAKGEGKPHPLGEGSGDVRKAVIEELIERELPDDLVDHAIKTSGSKFPDGHFVGVREGYRIEFRAMLRSLKGETDG